MLISIKKDRKPRSQNEIYYIKQGDAFYCKRCFDEKGEAAKAYKNTSMPNKCYNNKHPEKQMQDAIQNTIQDAVNFEKQYGGYAFFTEDVREGIIERVTDEAKEEFMNGKAKVLVAKPGIKQVLFAIDEIVKRTKKSSIEDQKAIESLTRQIKRRHKLHVLRKKKILRLEEKITLYKRKEARTMQIENDYMDEINDLRQQLKEAKEIIQKYEPTPKVTDTLGLAVVEDDDVFDDLCANLEQENIEACPDVKHSVVAEFASPSKPFADRTNDVLMLFGTKEKFVL